MELKEGISPENKKMLPSSNCILKVLNLMIFTNLDKHYNFTTQKVKWYTVKWFIPLTYAKHSSV